MVNFAKQVACACVLQHSTDRRHILSMTERRATPRTMSIHSSVGDPRYPSTEKLLFPRPAAVARYTAFLELHTVNNRIAMHAGREDPDVTAPRE